MSQPVSEPITLSAAAGQATERLLAERHPDGHWIGELSTSALSTSTAVMALHLAQRAGLADHPSLIENGLKWLADHQNDDGGWGDTVLSFSNISTTMLAHGVFQAADADRFPEQIRRSGTWIDEHGGIDAVIARYGKDRTFSVPILTHCALAGIVDWDRVMPLPFELACIPPRFYNAVRLPVVSYALPALIAIGQVIFHRRGHRNPIIRRIRRAAIGPSLKILERIQPDHGGFLEATPLTSFVAMSLIGAGHGQHPVTRKCLDFITASVRSDGSWPIDTNLATWVTTLSVNALSIPVPGDSADQGDSDTASAALPDADQRGVIRDWLLSQQMRSRHPYTQAAPGGWAWTDLPGGVPDADDTPGAMLALLNLRPGEETLTDRERSALSAAAEWLLNLQNRDGGWPTFCRGWGTLPFDRSACDLTAHALRALQRWIAQVPGQPRPLQRRTMAAIRRGVNFLQRQQADDGTWLPLWFGNQWNDDDANPLYGTARVVLGLCDLAATAPSARLSGMIRRGIDWIAASQNDDGSWSARRGLPGSVEETALGVEAVSRCLETGIVPDADLTGCFETGTAWLLERSAQGRLDEASPIGFYFAKLWYFERLYPIIFATSALRRAAAVSARGR